MRTCLSFSPSPELELPCRMCDWLWSSILMLHSSSRAHTTALCVRPRWIFPHIDRTTSSPLTQECPFQIFHSKKHQSRATLAHIPIQVHPRTPLTSSIQRNNSGHRFKLLYDILGTLSLMHLYNV